MPIILRDHQAVAVNAILHSALFRQEKGFLLADDVGLGKTYTAVFAMGRLLRYIRTLPPPSNQPRPPPPTLVIVCPLSVVAHWEDALIAAGYDLAAENIRVLNCAKMKRLFRVEKKKQGNKLVNTAVRCFPSSAYPT